MSREMPRVLIGKEHLQTKAGLPRMFYLASDEPPHKDKLIEYVSIKEHTMYIDALYEEIAFLNNQLSRAEKE